jgi:hypothetical protein
MIKTELILPCTLKITVPEKLKAGDFQEIAAQIDSLIKQQGKIRLLIDASNFGGWENISVFKRHIGFVKNHHQKVERRPSLSRKTGNIDRQCDSNVRSSRR